MQPVQRSQRSMSFSVRRSRDRNKKDEVMHSGSLKRSSSVKGRNEKENRPPTEETSSEPIVKTEKLKKGVHLVLSIHWLQVANTV